MKYKVIGGIRMNVKRLLCVILAMAVVFCTFPVIQVSASGYTIAQVKEKFPDGKYWNHLCKPGHYIGGWVHTGAACGDVENTVTDHPCTSNYVDVGVGGYSCNTYKNIATQCCGFAKKVANLAYGVYDCASSWSCVRDKNKVASVAKPGDVLHYTGYDSSGDGHWVVVISVSGNVVTVAECNYPDGTCQIKWGRQINVYELGDTIWLYQAPYKWTDCKHSYTSDSPYVCTKCKEWKTDSLKSTKSLSNVQFVITSNDAKDHTGPYGDCKSVNKYSKNTVVTAVQEVVNGYGHTWYKLSNGNYIFSDYVKKYSVSYTNIAEGTYYIKNVANGQYMVVSQSVDESYRGVLTWEMNGEPGMKMKIFKGPTGYKMMPSMSSTRLINPNADKVSSGNNINIVNDVNDSSQWWQFEKVGSYYVIHNVQNPSCVLDAPNGSHSAVFANNYTGASSQKWVLEPVNAPATYTLDVNGIIDSKSNGWLSNDNGYATFDMYINGSLVKNDVNDYNASHPAGTKYEIKDIKLHGLECYVGVSSGSLSGTINAATTIVLEFRSYHSWDVGTVISEPSATEIGVKLIKCTSCGETKEEILPATGVQRLINIIANIDNSETDVESIAGIGTFDVCINGVVVADDVTEYCEYHPEESKFEIRDIKVSEDKCFAGMYSGNAEYTDGVVSGTLFRDANIRLGFFTYHFGWDKQTTVQATCQNEGMEVHTCVLCGKTKEIKTERTNHDYEMIVKGQPTCTSDGIDVYKCRVCNHEWQNNYGKREHIYTKTIYEATCHEGAYELKVCVNCGDTIKDVFSGPLEHSWDEGTVTKNPTATETGIIAYKCHLCNATKTETIPNVEFLPGDVNLDGKITAADARLCLRAAARLDELSGTPRYAADYDNDNQIKAADARLILRKAAKLD